MDGFEGKVQFVWQVADLLRGDYKPAEYRGVILPLLVLRRLDAVLEESKPAVLARAEQLKGVTDNPDVLLRDAAGVPFYNVSPLTFTKLLDSPNNLAQQLRAYIGAFSPGAAQVLEKYRFDEQISRLDDAGLLYLVLGKFADLDLRPEVVPNHAMGYIFEELLRRFSELSNETAGEHFTPREVIRLIVNLLFGEDSDVLTGTAPVRSIYDPACGTGGMLNIADQYLTRLNPKARLEMFGQELNPETWAIARSDLLIQGQDPERIVLGNTLTADGHADKRFDYLLANPPFGVDWNKSAAAIKAEAAQPGGRFSAGLPRVSDGSLLFLQQMIARMKPAEDGGSRVAIVFSGSPLFAGAAESGESNIRRWIIENDWLEGIVALPDQLFYNTGISTYVWIVTNRKRPEREGKVALIDARGEWSKMRKSLGDKRKYLDDAHIEEITRLYHDAPELTDADERVKVFHDDVFGFRRITVERPLRRRWMVTEETVEQVAAAKPVVALSLGDDDARRTHDALLGALSDLVGTTEDTEPAFVKLLLNACTARKQIGLPPAIKKTVLAAAAVADPAAPVVTDKKGEPLPDPDLRDNENVPLTEDVDEYVEREVLPHVPDAWVDHTKTKIGYEIPFTRFFYRYVPPRPLAEIDAELEAVEAEIRRVLAGLKR
ncbi:type I restriction-modification system subunit M [Blastococcus saxobsidens]|uniref:site-specific DNA-methyltransferase (adenine-specific) n=1 Tax=Blastococcus saxobsidens (strain DD2) TaxID=1146883 RepID=H6RSX2_BLASD|nr:class I SAM-dependent DNA methyltransferase [Blastococcus saxobsidens]CCG03075.1 Type I restriction-modification system methyltransferase subunit [Blastococcus saxobsidens DD2]